MSYLNIQDEKVIPVVMELNTLLADYHLYYQKLRAFHWNILGKSFFDLHVKFEEMYNESQVKIDEIAERILTLRHHPVSKFSDYLKISSLKEASGITTDQDMVVALLADHKTILKQMSVVLEKADIAGDEGTIDFIGAYIGELEKTSWMLNAWSKSTNDQLKRDEVNS